MAKVNNKNTEPPMDEVEARVTRMMDPALPDVEEKPEEKLVEKSSSVQPDDQPGAPELTDKTVSIDDHGGKPEDVAQKLNESIAGLDAKDNSPVDPDLMPSADSEIDNSDVLADPEIDKAVDDIVAKEGDELLEVEDAIRDTDEEEVVKKPHQGLGKILKSWWSKPIVRKSVIITAVTAVLLAMLLPISRYFVLNTAGVRASSSLFVLDESTRQPLKNVKVTIGNVSSTSGVDGKVSLRNVKLGPNQLIIEKRAFAPVTRKVTLGWGSNPLGDFKLTPTGSQYSFTVKDFLSGKPISKVEASNNEASAVSDKDGVIKLTIDKPSDEKLTVTIKVNGYRTEQLVIDPNDKASREVKLVPARKHVFVSKRSGKYDIYGVFIDGKDEKLILAGTGNEREGMSLMPHPNSNVVAYVSTRGNQHNSDGYLLSNLILIDTSDNSTTNIVASERIEVINWSGDNLVYVTVAAGASGNSPKRYRLVSYNIKDSTSKELAASNYFNDVVAAGGAIYFAPSSAYQTGPTYLSKINPNGSGAQNLYTGEVWNIIRTAYDHFTLSVGQHSYDYKLGDKAPVKLNSAPANQTNRVYVDSPDGTRSIWIDNRDGKGVLISYDLVSKKDTTLKSQSGLSHPVRWMNNSAIVYRVKTDQETADYALSPDGGEPVKIRDVTNSFGLDSWSY